ncbi:hypothetical protein [Halobacteriovorax sp.]|uniref:hypothetical protein n=1 Tax=Halobacteriovorax sp. TaxID=2020862 RepID=UPI003564F0B9
MNLLKILVFITLSIGSTIACELPFQVTTNDTPSYENCKGLIIQVMKEQNCPEKEINIVKLTSIKVSAHANGVSFCSLTTGRGVYSAMEDFMSEPPVSSVFFSIWD